MAKRPDAFPLKQGSHGQRVKDAQWQLLGHNVFHLKFLEGGKDAIDGVVGKDTAQAFHDAKLLLGYPMADVDHEFGQKLRAYLLGEEKLPAAYKNRMKARAESYHKKKGRYYPLAKKGPLIGLPGQGTHSFVDPPNNWESDEAIDISIPVGTPVYAISDGVIGPEFGPLDDNNPRFAGIRLHLQVALPEKEWYYAHLSSTAKGIGPGVHVKAGQLLGKSGSANGAAHLHLGTTYGHNPAVIVPPLPLVK